MNIRKIEGYVLSSPYGNGKVFGQPKGVKSIAIVELHTDTGLIGYGETYAGIYSPELFVSTVNLLSERIVGKEILEDTTQLMNIPFVTGGGFVRSVLGAIDIALWDVRAQERGIPVYELLNPKSPNKIPIYVSAGSVVCSKEEIEAEVRYTRERGINHYKLRCGYQGIDLDAGRIETAIKTMGDDAVMVDYIQGTLNNLDKKGVIHIVDNLNNFNLYWVEEIVNPYDTEMLKRVWDISSNDIAMGEHLTNKLEFKTMDPWVDFIQPDVTQCGGFQHTREIVSSFLRVDTAMHCWGSSVSFMANSHFATSVGAMMEYPLVKLELNEHIIKSDIKRDGGEISLSDEPGLGIYISNEIKEKYKFVKGSGYKI